MEKEFNEENIQLIKRTWDKLAMNLFDHSDDIMYKYFEKYPEYLHSFPKFLGIPLDELKGKAVRCSFFLETFVKFADTSNYF